MGGIGPKKQKTSPVSEQSFIRKAHLYLFREKFPEKRTLAARITDTPVSVKKSDSVEKCFRVAALGEAGRCPSQDCPHE